jgi:hypothetical protein
MKTRDKYSKSSKKCEESPRASRREAHGSHCCNANEKENDSKRVVQKEPKEE